MEAKRRAMDIATGLGLLVAFTAMVTSVLIDGGSLLAFINIPSVIVVFGGSFGALITSYPLKSFLSLPKLIALSFKLPSVAPQELIEQFVKLADQARREGLLSLEEQVATIDDDLVKKGIMLIVDGVDPSVVRDILEIDNDVASRRHGGGIGMLETLGAVSPAMGMLGTVLGLIGVLGNLSDSESLGPAIAVAFLTTLYGVILANLIWNPMAKKLKENDKLETLGREVIVEGILAIQAGENPRIVREKLESFLAPKLRGQAAAANKDGE